MIFESEKEPTEFWRKFDDKGRQIYYKDDLGCEQTWKYDDQGRQIYYKDGYGCEYWDEYDDKGNCRRTKYASGTEIIREYDSEGHIIYYKESKPEPLKVEKENTGKENILFVICLFLAAIIFAIIAYTINKR